MQKLGHSSLDGLAEMARRRAFIDRWGRWFHTRGFVFAGLGCNEDGTMHWMLVLG